MVMLYQAQDVDFIADHEIHDPFDGISLADVMEV
jgi:hypothetical protein